MRCEVASKLNVELNETVHRYRYATSFYDHDLKGSTVGLQALGGAKLTQTCAKAGLTDSKQYLPTACVTTATKVMKTRTKQY